jgi:hypothetical protein
MCNIWGGGGQHSLRGRTGPKLGFSPLGRKPVLGQQSHKRSANSDACESATSTTIRQISSCNQFQLISLSRLSVAIASLKSLIFDFCVSIRIQNNNISIAFCFHLLSSLLLDLYATFANRERFQRNWSSHS